MDIRRIERIITNCKDESSLIKIIVEYFTLKQKLENPEKQSWYFKQGIESSKRKLIELNEKFEEIRKIFNETTIDELIERINKNQEIKSFYETNGMNTIQQIHYSSILSNNKFYSELLHLKSKTKILMDINHYLENPDELLIFFE